MKRVVIAVLLVWAVAGAIAVAQSTDDARIIGALRTLNTAQVAYYGNHLSTGYACTLAQLGPKGANLINAQLASGSFGGYRIELKCSTDNYQAVAIPTQQNSATFCIDKSAGVRTAEQGKDCITEGHVPKVKRASIPTH